MTDGVRNLRGSSALFKWMQFSLYGQIVIALISIWSSSMEYWLLSGFQHGDYSGGSALRLAAANDQRQGVVALVYIGVYIVSGFLILRWIHRANSNARALGVVGMRFTPGWAIGWYFVPIFSLWKPFQAMKEIWKASSGAADRETQSSSPLLGWWWFAWLMTGFLGNLAMQLGLRAESIGELIFNNVVNQISDFSGILLSIVFLALAGRIQKMQASRAVPNSYY